MEKHKYNYKEYLESNKWKEFREKVLKRDNYKCTKCGNTNELCIHHITYDNFGNENLEDVVTLCSKCHEEIHNTKNWNKTKNKITKKDIDLMIEENNIDTFKLYQYLVITKQMNWHGQIRLLGNYINAYTQKQLLEDFTILGYIMRIVDKTHNFSSIVMKNRKTPIKNWGELWELINCNKPQTQSKVKKYLLDNKILKTMKISSMSNKLETRFILNPFLFRGANYSSQLAIILFSEYIKEDINISTYPLRWLESLGYITR